MTDDERSIRALIERWHNATAEGDVDTVLTLMSEDVEFLVPGRDPMRGRAAFAAGLRTLLKTHRIHSSGDVQEVKVSGDLAFALTQLKVRVIPLGTDQENARSGYALSVFRKQGDGVWLLVRDVNLLPSSA
ncbi:YybH family protein [Rhodanobacter umsongensis]|uniref:YybH family protein n=1 Tax=Rhodanobacter umsongensis TaxID=633153 RepID=A0ABW0JJP7_9GAMM